MDAGGKRGFRLSGVIFAAAGLLAAVALFCFDPTLYHFYPRCIFHSATGLMCPGCGSLRALHELLHGRVAAAFRFNPLLMACLPLLAGYVGASAWRRFHLQSARPTLSPVWMWTFLAVVVLFGVLRNLPGEPFAMLRP
jgi:hypothetical protein